MIGVIRVHARWLSTLSPIPFTILVGLESFVASIIAAFFLMGVIGFHSPGTHHVGNAGWGLIAAPLIETALFQFIPVRLAQLFTTNRRTLLLVGWLPFALAHFMNGIGSGIAAGLCGGFFFGFSYVNWVGESHVLAFVVTAMCHGFHNALTFALTIFR